jgi:hypothetical protein
LLDPTAIAHSTLAVARQAEKDGKPEHAPSQTAVAMAFALVQLTKRPDAGLSKKKLTPRKVEAFLKAADALVSCDDLTAEERRKVADAYEAMSRAAGGEGAVDNPAETIDM